MVEPIERFNMKELIQRVSNKTLSQFKKTDIFRVIDSIDKDAFLKNECKSKYYNAVLYWANPEYGAFIEFGDDWESLMNDTKTIKEEGYIYLIKLSDTLFKFGRTANVRKRMNQYPRGAELLQYDYVKNMVEAEKILLTCAEESRGVHDIGNEYYRFDDPTEPLQVYFKALERIPI